MPNETAKKSSVKKKPAAKKKVAAKKAAKKPAAKKAAKKPAAKKKVAAKKAAKKPAAKKAAKKPAAKKAAKKPAKTPPVAPPAAASGELLRGVALVDATMAMRQADGQTLHGRDAELLAATTLGDRPLTPALRRWLELDDDMFVLGEPTTFAEMVEAEFPEFSEFLAPIAAMLPAPCVLFEGWGCDSRRFVYLGKADEQGEYPVFTLDTDDVPFVCVNGPVDVWLAQQAGFLAGEHVYGYVPPEYEATRRVHAELNFGGYVSFEDFALDGEAIEDLDADED